jgi:hypothetical protein
VRRLSLQATQAPGLRDAAVDEKLTLATELFGFPRGFNGGFGLAHRRARCLGLLDGRDAAFGKALRHRRPRLGERSGRSNEQYQAQQTLR